MNSGCHFSLMTNVLPTLFQRTWRLNFISPYFLFFVNLTLSAFILVLDKELCEFTPFVNPSSTTRQSSSTCA